MMYFNEADGSYGDADDITEDTKWTCKLPTWHWTPAMIQRIADVDPSVRCDIASHFGIGVHRMNAVTMMCYKCGLTMVQLNEGALIEGWNKQHTMALSIDE